MNLFWLQASGCGGCTQSLLAPTRRGYWRSWRLPVSSSSRTRRWRSER